LHLVGYILEYIYDAQTHERQKNEINSTCRCHFSCPEIDVYVSITQNYLFPLSFPSSVSDGFPEFIRSIMHKAICFHH